MEGTPCGIPSTARIHREFNHPPDHSGTPHATMVDCERRWSRPREERSSTKGERCMHPVLIDGLTLSFACTDFGSSSVKHAALWSPEPISKSSAGTLWGPPKSCCPGYSTLPYAIVTTFVMPHVIQVALLPGTQCLRKRTEWTVDIQWRYRNAQDDIPG